MAGRIFPPVRCRSMPDLLANLNPEQYAAVTLPNEPALILAGAGSGKTRVLTTRIAWLIQKGWRVAGRHPGRDVHQQGRKEMQALVRDVADQHARHVDRHFHGLCNRMLRAHWRDAGLPQTFQILDGRPAVRDQAADEGRERRRREIPAEERQYFINNAKEQGLRPTRSTPTTTSTASSSSCTGLRGAMPARGRGRLPELLLRCYELLAQRAAAPHYQARFRHILVDEFQDTNKLQYAWLKMLAGAGNAVFAVGDDDQSIYAFRGANVGNMRDFETNSACAT
jgi:DNA helicase-2/ATP-dependent DNA helicase PcrA